MSPAPVVSVVIPTHNRSRFLPSAVRSALAQTVRDIEVIIIDDGSTDDTAAVAARLSAEDHRARVVHQPNRGLAAARNRGIAETTAPVLAFLDDDDLWHPEALEVLQAGLAGGAPAAAARCAAFTSSDPELSASDLLAHPELLQEWPPAPAPAVTTLRDLVLAPRIPVHAAVFLRQTLSRSGGFDERRAAAEDYALWLGIALLGDIPVAGRTVAYYRRHPGQMAGDQLAQSRETRLALEGFLAAHPEIGPRVGRLAVRRRIAGLHREEAYEAFHRGRRRETAAAALRSLTRWPLQLKAWAYLAAAPAAGRFSRWQRSHLRGETLPPGFPRGR